MDEKAFPSGNGVNPYCYGMDLRDYFAAKAMQAIIAASKNITVGVGEETTNLNIAYASFSIAEAMIKARNA